MIRRCSRRAFVASLAALVANPSIVLKPQSAYAQRPALPWHIGVLLITPIEDKALQMFRQGLQEAGYVEGRDVVIDWRSANGDFARIPEFATDLVKRKVDVIVVETTPATMALKRATSSIPIVMSLVGDPVRSGLVRSLAHPGGNVTGLSLMAAELGAKRLELLKQAIPRLTRVAVLWNPGNPWHAKANADLKAAAPALSLKLSFVSARTAEEFSPAFAEINRTHAQALYLTDDGIFFTHRTALLDLVSKARFRRAEMRDGQIGRAHV